MPEMPHVRALYLNCEVQACYQLVHTLAHCLQLRHLLASPDEIFSGLNFFRKFCQFTKSKIFRDWTRVVQVRELKVEALEGLPATKIFALTRGTAVSMLDVSPTTVKEVVCDLPKKLRDLATSKHISSKTTARLRRISPSDVLAEVVSPKGEIYVACRAETESEARKEALASFEQYLLALVPAETE